MNKFATMKDTYNMAILYLAILGVVATQSTSLSRSEFARSILSVTCDSDNILHLIPHETMCDYYYTCFNGNVNPIPTKCKRNLLFNSRLRVCDYPENVDCSINVSSYAAVTALPSTTVSTPSISQPPSSTQSFVEQLTSKEIAPTTNALDKSREVCSKESIKKTRIPHNCHCDLYYECKDGEQILQTCPIGKHFDYIKEVCDLIDIVNCVQPILTYDLEISNHNSECFPEGKTFEHESNSSAYYLCLEGRKILQNCAAEQHFYVTLQRCEYPQNATYLTSNSSDFFATFATDTCPPSSSTKKVFLPHDCLCTKYYECINGRKHLRFCEKGLYYDRTLKTCVDPVKADCEHKYPKKCPPSGSSKKVYLPHECTCFQYYKCVNGRKHLRFCPKGLYFDRFLQICTDPNEADCAVKTSTTTSTTTSTDSSTDTTSTDTTSTDTTTTSTDTTTTSTDTTTTSTDTTTTSTDTTTTSTDTPTTPTEPTATTPKLDVKCPAKGTALIPDKILCHVYYECVDGKATYKECLPCCHFDPERQVCDLISIVNCIRPLPFYTTYNDLDPATCIGTCPEEDPEDAVLLPNEDCKKFCLCSNGFAWVQSCPEPLYFDSVDKVCKYKKDAVCAVRLLNRHLVSTQDKIDDQNELEYLIHQENTRKHEAYDKSASKNTIYNLDPATCIGTCPEEDPEDAVLLPNEDCKKFCLCSNGFAWVQSCPEPLYFDSVDKVCKYKKDAVCAVRLLNRHLVSTQDKIDDQNELEYLIHQENTRKHEAHDKSVSKKTFYNLDPATCIGTCPEEDPEDAVLLPNEDCKKFCLCSNGFAWVQSCPEPLYFDSVDKVCKFKKDALCAVRTL